MRLGRLSCLMLVLLLPAFGCQRKEPQADASVDEQNAAMACLHLAMQAENVEEVRALIAQGVDVNARDFLGKTPLYLAAEEGRAGMAKLLVAAGADVKVQMGDSGTALHVAAREGHKEIVELLVANGADVNAKRQRRLPGAWTPLHEAVHGDHPDVAQFLIEHRADVNARDSDGLTPLFGAGDVNMAELLLKAGAEIQPKKVF